MLILKRPWTQQPQTLPRIDWSNPVTRGLEFCAVPFGNTFVDLVTGVVGTRGGTPTRKIATLNGGYATTPWAATIERAGASDYVAFPPSATLRGGSLTATNSGTLLALAGSAQADGVEYSVIGSTEGIALGDGPCLGIDSYSWSGRGNIQARRYQSVVQHSTEAGGIGTSFGNRLHFFGFAYGSSSISYFARGAETTSGAAPAVGSNTADRRAWVLKSDVATSGTAGAYVALGLIWARKLTVDEYARLYRNPWSLFVPRRILVPVSVGGGGSAAIDAAAGASTASTLSGSSTAAATISAAAGAATASEIGGSSVAAAAISAAAGAATAATLASSGGTASAIDAAAGIATASTLAAASTAAAAFTQAAGAATAPALVGTSTVAADFGVAAGVATASAMAGAIGGSAIDPASGMASASVLAGSSIAVADISPAAGSATAAELASNGEATPTTAGVPGRTFRRTPYVVFIDGRRYIGTEEEIRAVIEEFAEEQAERAILQAKKPKAKPRIVVEPGRAVEGKVFKDMAPAPQVAQQAISLQTDMRRLYAQAVERMLAAFEADEEESLISLL